MDIGAWLKELGLERYAEAFRANEIDAQILPALTAEDLKDLGVTTIGHRRKLLNAVAALGAAETAEAASPGSVAPPPDAERRQLTVMFCDLVDSTALASRLDPEDMGQVIRAYQECCAGVVRRWDGHVAKYMGDGVLVYFGYPKAHEDDAERAVRAGLELTAAVGRLGESEAKPNVAASERRAAFRSTQATNGGTALAARVGIATGLVMVGDLVGDAEARERAVVGETPNLAARLQALAEPGDLVIAPGTRQLIGGLFDLEDLGEHPLKGFAAPVRAWRVGGASTAESRFEALHGGRLTPLIGREHELALLLERFERARDGDGQVVLLAGEPGIGKSRIVQALRARLADQPYTALSHYCSPHHTSSALHPVIGLLERAAGFSRGDESDARLAKLEALLVRGTDRLDEAAPHLADLLGIPVGDRYPALNLSPQRKGQRTLEVLVEQVEGLAARQPVLAVYEDAHWIDPTTLEALSLLIERVQRLPVLVLITFRPEFAPPWTGHAHVTQLSLARLTRRHGAAMVARVGGKALPDEVLEQIVARTDGVPLFVEELTKTVLESGLLRDAGDHYEPTGPLPALAIPATLQDSLMSRLDRLAPVKEAAQTAAAIGREFPYELLAAVSPLPAAQLNDALRQLVASELIFRRGAPPEATYRFKHTLVQDVAYQSLLRSRRRQLHASIAQVLEESVANPAPEVLAHHYTEAAQFRPAVTCWLSAGRKASERSADREAVVHLTKGLELVEHLPDWMERALKELDLRVTLGSVLANLKASAAPEVAEVYERALDLCREVGNAEQTFPVLWGLWMNRNTSGRLRAAEALANELIRVADDLPESVFRLQAHHAAWTVRFALGEFSLALQHVEQGMRDYDLERHHTSTFVYGGHDAGACAYSSGSLVEWLLGHPDRALRHAQEGLILATQISHPFSYALAMCYKVILHQLRGEPDLAGEEADSLLAHCAQHELKFWSSNGQILKGWTLASIGEVDEGLRLCQQALDERSATGVKARQAYYLAILAEALGAAGQPAKGLDVVADALAMIDSTEERRWEAIALRVHGDLLLAVQDRAEAEAQASFRRAIQVARGQQARSLELRAATSLARLWGDQGQRTEARDLLAPIYDWFTEGFGTADLRDAKALLDELG